MWFEDYIIDFIDRTPLTVRLIIVICIVAGIVVASFVSPTSEKILPEPTSTVTNNTSVSTNQPISDEFIWQFVIPILGL